MKRLELRHLWLACPIALIFIFCCRWTCFQYDLWQHLSCGRWMVQTGRVMDADYFSHTIAGQPLVDQNWLAQIVLYYFHRLGGIRLLSFVTALVYAATFSLTAYCSWKRSNHCRIAAFCTFLAIALGLVNLTIRPQLFSVLFFAGELTVLWNLGCRVKPLATAVIVLLWTNMHGVFVLGVILPGIFLAGRAIPLLTSAGRHEMIRDQLVRSYFACCLLAGVVAFCNPQPRHTLDYVTQSAANGITLNVQEWRPVGLRSFPGVAFCTSVALTLVVLNLSKKRLDLTEVLLIVFFLLLGQKAMRMLIWWGLIIAPVLAAHLATMFKKEAVPAYGEQGRLTLNYLLAGGMVAGLLAALPWMRAESVPDDEPRSLVEFLKGWPASGKVFNPLEWGGYLTWHQDGRLKVFGDGRIDPFPLQMWQDYISIIEGRQNWEDLLDRYDVNVLIASKDMTPKLLSFSCRSVRWSKVYEDPLSVVYERVERGPL